MRKIWKYSIICFACIIFLLIILSLFNQPSNTRDWAEKHKVLPKVTIDGDKVTIFNIRNATLVDKKINFQYYDDTFDLSKIKRLWLAVEPFMEWEGGAHTLFSFEFDDGKFISLSVEARAEKGEKFNLLYGLFNKYELIYVFVTEHDAIGLRTKDEMHNVYLYPINTTRDKVKAIFLDVANYANQLNEHPEFYNSISNTCTTNLFKHANRVTPGKIPFSFKRYIPGYSDKIIYSLGLMDTDIKIESGKNFDKDFQKIRDYYNVKEISNLNYDDSNYSVEIRKDIVR